MIKLFVSDIDGTLTDGTIEVTSTGEISKRYSRIDGYGITKLLNTGVRVMILTSSKDTCDNFRFKAWEDGENFSLNQGIEDKYTFLKDYCEKEGIDIATEVAYIGDDENDLECLDAVKIYWVPSSSKLNIFSSMDRLWNWAYGKGGRGAVRLAIEEVIALNKEETNV
jgi:N-acylneuraminate cytidylyltransferase